MRATSVETPDPIELTRLASGPDRATSVARLSGAIAWSGMVAGALLGLVMGLWAFDGPVAPPSFVGDYGDTSRRLLRLGHIACFGLGALNLLLVREWARIGRATQADRWAAWTMNFGNVCLPAVLVAAAVYQPLKYLLPIPALSVLAALVLTAHRVRLRDRSAVEEGLAETNAS